ncbi:MAG: HTH domain-containing protein [Acidimicrobiia bacterium]
MSALDAAAAVLGDAGEPLHYREITKRMLDSGLWVSAGKTPDATVNAQIVTEINKKGSESRFVRTAPGVFGLNDGLHDRYDITRSSKPEGTLTFLNSAHKVLSENEDRQPMHYKAITESALDQGLLDTKGLTPEATMYAQIVTNVNKAEAEGEISRFVKHGRGLVGLTEWEGVGVAVEIRQHNKRVREELLGLVSAMDPAEFEEMLGRVLAEMGFDEIEVTKYHGDKGIDLRGTLVVAGGIEVRMAVQAKRWKHAVQAPEVQKVRGATSAHERAMIITTSSFGKGARAEAERGGFTPVGLIDGEDLIGLMVKHQIGVRRENQVVIELDEDSL